MRYLALSAFLLALFVIAPPALADHCTPCLWLIKPRIDVDPAPRSAEHYSEGESVYWDGRGFADKAVLRPELQAYTIPVWGWRYQLDADAWTMAATCDGYSYAWGFPSVSDAMSGAGQWIIYQIQTCCTPVEDIEIDVRQQFHVEGALNADEKLEVRGALEFWCAKTKSTHRPNKAVYSVAAGGVSIDDDYDEEDKIVAAEFPGLKFRLVASSGGSQTDDPIGFDNGIGGTSPEIVNTSTRVAITMDLDSWDTCSGSLSAVWWCVHVVATCDGCCRRCQVMIGKNTYPKSSD